MVRSPKHQHRDPIPLSEFSFGPTKSLPNDFLVLELESLSAPLREKIGEIIENKPISQALIPDIVGGVMLSQLHGSPPMPLSLHAATSITGSAMPRGNNENAAFEIFRATIGAALAYHATAMTRAILAIPIFAGRILNDHTSQSSTELNNSGLTDEKRTQYNLRAILPYIVETTMTKQDLPKIINEQIEKGLRISSSLIDNSLLGDYNRVQLDNRGRLVYSKHPFSKRSTKVGFLKQLNELYLGTLHFAEPHLRPLMLPSVKKI